MFCEQQGSKARQNCATKWHGQHQSNLPESRFKDVLVEREKCASDSDVGQGDALADQEGLMQEVVVENLEIRDNHPSDEATHDSKYALAFKSQAKQNTRLDAAIDVISEGT